MVSKAQFTMALTQKMIEDVRATFNDLKMIFQEMKETFRGFHKTPSCENSLERIELQSPTLQESTNDDSESHARGCELKANNYGSRDNYSDTSFKSSR